MKGVILCKWLCYRQVNTTFLYENGIFQSSDYVICPLLRCDNMPVDQWRTEGVLGVQTPPRNSEVLTKLSRISFCSSLCSHTVVIY
jgi:hypothetical protein